MLDVTVTAGKTKLALEHSATNQQPNTDDAATYARIMAQRQAALPPRPNPTVTGGIFAPCVTANYVIDPKPGR